MPQQLILPIYTTVAKNPVTIFKKMDESVFDYPFFNDGVHHTIKTDASIPSNYSFTDIQLSAENKLLKIKGFIFHTSHCGSTLLSRMLGSSAQVRVVSETEAINGLLLSYALYHLPEKDVMVQLKAIMETYRQPAEDQKFLVFKLTSWNVFFIHLFQQIYPDVRWLYLDRDTNEVVNSLVKKGGGFAEWWEHPVDVFRKYFLGNEIKSISKENYLVQMVEHHRRFAITYKNEAACFLYYPGFIKDFERRILPHFLLPFSGDEIKKAMAATAYDSKKTEKVLFTGM